MAFGFKQAGNTKGGLGDRVTWDKGMKSQIVDIFEIVYIYIRFWIGKFWKEATPFWASLCKYQSGIGFIHSTNEPSSGMTNDKWRAFWTKSFTWGKCSFRLSGLQEFMLKWGWTKVEPTAKTNSESTSICMEGQQNWHVVCVCVAYQNLGFFSDMFCDGFLFLTWKQIPHPNSNDGYTNDYIA